MISDLLGTTSLQPVILGGGGAFGDCPALVSRVRAGGIRDRRGLRSESGRQRNKKLAQPVLSMDKLPEFVRENRVKMAILTVPGTVAQEVANAFGRGRD